MLNCLYKNGAVMAGRKRVLIIEDDKSLLEILSSKLSEVGLSAVKARDGEEGLSLALEKQPSLILLDLHLPRINGRKLLRLLRRDDRSKSIPIIILTNDGSPLAKEEALELATPAFFVKAEPSLSAVVDAVNYHLSSA